MANVKVYKLTAVPSLWEANAVYYVKLGSELRVYVTDSVGTPYLCGVPEANTWVGSNTNKSIAYSSGDINIPLHSGVYDGNAMNGAPVPGWFTLLNMRHQNETNHYGAQIGIGDWTGNFNLYYRAINNGNPSGWRTVWTDAHFNPNAFPTRAVITGGFAGDNTITHQDSRFSTDPPANYTVSGVGGTWWDFKTCGTVSLPASNYGFATVMTVAQWNPAGGGGGVHQFAFNDNLGMSYRYGYPNASSWEVWEKIVTLKNRQFRIAQNIDNNESVEAILGYTDGLGNYEKVKLISTRFDNAARQHFAIAVNTAYSTASATIADARFFIDGTTGYVGIGTTNPLFGLDIVGTARTANGLRATGSLYTYTAQGWAATIKMDSGNALVFTDKFGIGESGGHLYFSTSSNGAASGSAIYAMVIANGGEVIVSGPNNITNGSGSGAAFTVWGNAYVSSGINIGNTNLYLFQGTGNSLTVSTASGSIEIGAQNTGFCHYQTDRPAHYFNKETNIDGPLKIYGTSTSLSNNRLVLGSGYTIASNTGFIGFYTASNLNVALPIKAAALTVSSNYSDNAPSNGVYVQGLSWLNGGLQLGGLNQSANTSPASFRLLSQNLNDGLVEWVDPNDLPGGGGADQWRKNDFNGGADPYIQPDPNIIETYGVDTRGGFATKDMTTIAFNLGYSVDRYDYCIMCINDNAVHMPDPHRFIGRILEFKFISGDRTTNATTHLVDYPVVDYDRDYSSITVSKSTARIKVQAAYSNLYGDYVWEVLDYNTF